MGSLGTTDVSDPPTVLQTTDWPATAPPTVPPSTPRPSARLHLVTALVGLLCGALAVGGIWLGGAFLDKPAEGPSGDAAVACAILEDLPSFTAQTLDSSDGSRLYAATELSAAAAGADQRYRRLAETTREAYLSSSDLDVEAVNRQVKVAVAEC
jgi:hypothetical protein